MLESFSIGLASVLTPSCLLFIVGGVFIGIIFGAIPGLSATMALALFLPVTYSMDSVSSVILLTSLYVGGISGGLISAILTGIPGTPSSVATCFDGWPILIGLFAIAEIVSRVSSARTAQREKNVDVNLKGIKGFGFSVKEAISQIRNFIMCSCIGTAIGILPGIGGGAANVMAYSVSQSTSKHPEKYGTGIIDGIVATESSNNAAVGGALVPLLSLGIPGDTVTAMLLGGLTLHGVTAGPLMFTQHTDVVYSIFITMIIASVVMLFMEFYGLRGFAKLLAVPKYYLLPAIFLCCIVGAYGTRHNIFDVWSVLVFGLLGVAFSKLKIPSAPFILGFIIGPLAENNLRRGLMFAQGDFGTFFTRPIADVFFIAAAISLVFGIYKSLHPKKKTAAQAAAAEVDNSAEKLGVNIVVENIAGANGAQGMLQVMDSDPDGYTCLFFHDSMLTNYLVGICDYNYTDLKVCAATISDNSYVLAVNSDSGYTSLQDVVDAAKAEPGQLLYASSVGGYSYYLGRKFEQAYDVDFNIVDAGGGTDRNAALLAGTIDTNCNPYGVMKSYFDSGDFTAVACLSDERNPLFPDVPTAAEQGYDWIAERHYFLSFPKDTDDAIVEKMAGVIEEICQDPEFIKATEDAYCVTPTFIGTDDLVATLDAYFEDFIR